MTVGVKKNKEEEEEEENRHLFIYLFIELILKCFFSILERVSEVDQMTFSHQIILIFKINPRGCLTFFVLLSLKAQAP